MKNIKDLTVQDFFTAVAMHALLSNPDISKVLQNVTNSKRHDSIAETAVLQANAIVKQLNSNPQVS